MEQTLHLGMTSLGSAQQFGPIDVRYGLVTAQFQYALPFVLLPDGSAAPYLMESYETNEDASIYTLHVDSRAVWSDGTPVTASDVKACWEWMTDPVNESTGLTTFFGLSRVKGWQDMADGNAEEITGLVVKDEKTLEMQLTGTDFLLPISLTSWWAMVFNVEDAKGDPDYFMKPYPLVNGPYQITDLHPTGMRAVLELNPEWWGDTPVITKIIMQAYSDPFAHAIAMENGQIDVADISNKVVKKDTMERIGGYMVTKQALSFAFASFKSGVEPVDDVNLRKALIHAVDFETMVEVASAGTSYVWRAPGLAEGIQCYDPSTASYTEYNVELAKEYLAKSKYKTGDQVPKIRMTPNGTGVSNIKSMQIMQEAWRVHLGITDVEIKEQPGGYGDDQNLVAIERQSTGARPVDAAVLGMNTWHSGSQAATRWMGGYKNPQVDELIDKALAMSRDDPEFCPTVRQAEDLFLDDAMLIPLYANHDENLQRDAYLAQPYVKNAISSPGGYLLLWREPMMSIEK